MATTYDEERADLALLAPGIVAPAADASRHSS